jgi:hypothetical protein
LIISGSDLMAGTNGNGAWRRPTTTGVRQTDATTPDAFILEQNFPNPFNPSTTIVFRIADFGPVFIKVFDMLGREVATLVNELLHAGTYQTMFDASGLASSVYYYTLSAGNYSEAKRMLLLK